MNAHSSSVSRARPVLGTLVEIRIPRATPDAPGAFRNAFAAIERVHRLMSKQHEESDLARIRSAPCGVPIEIDPWTYEVLERAHELHRLTGGLFDCAAAAEAAPRAGWSNLELLCGHAVRKRRPLALTLDGIAKGYAVDRAIQALRDAGVDWGVVNAGGDLRVFGPAREPVHVRHPCAPGELILIGSVSEAGVASSASYFCNASLVDPRTAARHATELSVTIIAADCMTADALTKPCLLDPEGAAALARRCDARAVIIGRDGNLH